MCERAKQTLELLEGCEGGLLVEGEAQAKPEEVQEGPLQPVEGGLAEEE